MADEERREWEAQPVEEQGLPRWVLARLEQLERENARLRASERHLRWVFEQLMSPESAEMCQAQERMLRERLEHERAEQLLRTNAVLQQALNTLARRPPLDTFLGHMLTLIAEQCDAPIAEYWHHPGGDTAFIGMMSRYRRVYNREQIVAEFPDHPGVAGFKVPAGMIFDEPLQRRRRYFVIEDCRTNPYTRDIGWMVREGLTKEINVPMTLGDDCIGALIVRMPTGSEITEQKVQLAQTLVHLATLACRLTCLAEEAKEAAVARERETIARERVAELTRANAALRQTVDALAADSNLERFLSHVLALVASLFETPLVEYYTISADRERTHLTHAFCRGRILSPAELARDPRHTLGLKPPAVLIHGEPLDRRRHAFLIDDMLTNPHQAAMAAQVGIDIIEWCQRMGVAKQLNIPLVVQECSEGALVIYLPPDKAFTAQEIELGHALAQQVNLALQFTQLAEQARRAAVLEERNRIAREIHDTLAQSFMGIIVQLQAAENDHTSTHERAIHIQQAKQLARESLSEARRSVKALRPSGLDTAQFYEALRQFIERRSAGYPQLQTDYLLRGTPYPLPPEVENHLLRIAQEAVSNALKHGEARRLRTELVFEATRLYLAIEDDGCGFDASDFSLSQGFGLTSMRERAEQIGAQLAIDTRPGTGTRIAVIVPRR